MGDGWEASDKNTAAAIDAIPKDIIICDWHYSEQPAYPSIDLFLEKGFRVWPASWKNRQTGLAMVIFLAGLTAVPRELTEASQIDGANYWQSVRHVVIPLLQPASIVVIALAVINSLKSFDILYMMTRGGPFHSSDNLAMMVYNESFQKYRMGYGSTVAVVLFMITLFVIAIYFRQQRGLEQLYD